jgi:hypothetical protein
MYSLKQILHGLQNPQMLLWELNRAYFSTINEFPFNDRGIDIFAEDWDTLVILDSCRVDAFEQSANFPGTTERRQSLGSMTREWVEANFATRRLHDTVYVTAINQIDTLPEEHRPELHDFVWITGEDVSELLGEMRVILPSKMTDRAIELHDEYPNKRIIVHYAQPHQPYIGPSGRKFQWTGDFHQNIKQSDVTRAEVWEAYGETLDCALTEVGRLLSNVEGRVIISADHGEMLGERMFPIPISHYGHPYGIYVDELVEVPWHVYESGPRRRIVEEAPQELNSVEESELITHLDEMGYV